MPKVKSYRVDFKIQYEHKHDDSMRGSIPHTIEMLPSYLMIPSYLTMVEINLSLSHNFGLSLSS